MRRAVNTWTIWTIEKIEKIDRTLEMADNDQLDQSPHESVTPGNGVPDHGQDREAIRENAKRVIRDSGIGEMLQTLNRQALAGRGWFEEYDSGILFKWGSGFTRRHIWIDIHGDQLRFRLRHHLKCGSPVPLCDGEYHTLTPQMWRVRGVVLRELNRNYERPVAETSED